MPDAPAARPDTPPPDRTVGGAKRFITRKSRSFEVPVNSASAMVTALNKVFGVDPDPDSVPLLDVDLDGYFDRFRIMNPGLTDVSFGAYRSRVRRARTMYGNWLAGEPWRTPAQGGGRRTTAGARSTRRQTTAGAGGQEDLEPRRSGPAHTAWTGAGAVEGGGPASDEELFDYKIALVDSRSTAVLRLPKAYSAADADRMAALIQALAVPTLDNSGR